MMVERYRPKKVNKPPRRSANRKNFTEQNVARLSVKPFQHWWWDAGTGSARGLGVQVYSTGTKTYFVRYKFPGSKKLRYKKLGRVGELTLEEARAAATEARRLANQNKDPKADDPAKSDTFGTAFRAYIQQEQIGRKKNTSALETQGVVLNRCEEWEHQPVATISYREIDGLLAAIRDGDPHNNIKPRPSAALRVYAHLKDFFKWCARSKIVLQNPMTDMPPPFTAVGRDRYFSDAELKAIWKAAGQLDIVESSYVKLIILLATRKDELAKARWTELDDPIFPTVFTVPTERVKLKAELKHKKKPVYIVPLPPRAQGILKDLRASGVSGSQTGVVFPGLKPDALKAKLVKLGAPEDFKLHTVRHTAATFLQNKGHSEYERGLVLNHSGSGSVTAGYSHGYPVRLKSKLLEIWENHIQEVVGTDLFFAGLLGMPKKREDSVIIGVDDLKARREQQRKIAKRKRETGQWKIW